MEPDGGNHGDGSQLRIRSEARGITGGAESIRGAEAGVRLVGIRGGAFRQCGKINARKRR